MVTHGFHCSSEMYTFDVYAIELLFLQICLFINSTFATWCAQGYHPFLTGSNKAVTSRFDHGGLLDQIPSDQDDDDDSDAP